METSVTGMQALSVPAAGVFAGQARIDLDGASQRQDSETSGASRDLDMEPANMQDLFHVETPIIPLRCVKMLFFLTLESRPYELSNDVNCVSDIRPTALPQTEGLRNH